MADRIPMTWRRYGCKFQYRYGLKEVLRGLKSERRVVERQSPIQWVRDSHCAVRSLGSVTHMSDTYSKMLFH